MSQEGYIEVRLLVKRTGFGGVFQRRFLDLIYDDIMSSILGWPSDQGSSIMGGPGGVILRERPRRVISEL